MTNVKLSIVAEKDKLDVTVIGVRSVNGVKHIPFTLHISILKIEASNGSMNLLYHWRSLLLWLQTQGISSLAVGNLVASPLTASILTVATCPEIWKLYLALTICGRGITTHSKLQTFGQKLKSYQRTRDRKFLKGMESTAPSEPTTDLQ